MDLGVGKPVPQLGLELAELLVRPKDEGGIPDAGPPQPQDEHVVALGRVPLLDVVDGHLLDAAVRGLAARQQCGFVVLCWYQEDIDILPTTCYKKLSDNSCEDLIYY